jgi:hypothetical protein
MNGNGGNGGSIEPRYRHGRLPGGLRVCGPTNVDGRMLVSGQSENLDAAVFFTMEDIRALLQFAEDCEHFQMAAKADEFLRNAETAAAGDPAAEVAP